MYAGFVNPETNACTDDSSRGVVLWRSSLADMCLVSAAALLLSCTFMLSGSAICFLMKLTLHKLAWPFAWIATVAIILWNPGQRLTSVSLVKRIAALLVAVVTWIFSI